MSLQNNINKFLSDEEKAKLAQQQQQQQQQQEMDCSSGVCVIKGDKSLVERINKKIITEDGRELLM